MTPYYSDDLVTLYHGDCLDITEWLEADVLVTDPPYGVSLCARSGTNRRRNTPLIAGEAYTSQDSSRTIPEEHVALRNQALKLWGDRPAISFGSWRAPRPPKTQMRLVWDKVVAGMGGVGAWRPADEEIYLLNWPNPKFASRPHGSVIRCQVLLGSERPDHPTPKPVGLMEHLIAECPPGNIADPFAGSGSTLVAAKALGRRAIGVELEERYCEIAARRLAQDTLFGGAA